MTLLSLLAGAAAAPAPVPRPSPAQGTGVPDQLLGAMEGALRNTTPLPSDPTVVAALRQGDAAYARAGTDSGALNAAFDAWRSALSGSALGAAAPAVDPGAPPALFSDPDGTLGRRAEGAPEAVLRRLNELSQADLTRWRERFEPEAAAALAIAASWSAPRSPYGAPQKRPQTRPLTGPAEALGRIERDFPLTEAAARAALGLADLALERGRAESARVYLARARRHAACLASDATARGRWDAAITRRVAALTPEPRRSGAGRAQGAPAHGSTGTGTTPTLTPLRLLRIEGARRSGLAPLGRDVQPGLAVLADGALILQTPRALALLDRDAAGGAPEGDIHIEPIENLVDLGGGALLTAPSAGGWPLLPATDGARIALVLGRGAPGRRFRDLPLPARGNVLAVVERGVDRQRPQLVWQFGDLGRLRRDESPPPPTEPILGPDGAPWGGGFEFQPGPVIADGAVFALARRLADPTDDAEALPRADTLRLFRFELATGDLTWWRDLTRASELGEEATRGSNGVGIATAAAPLAVADGAVLVATNVGLLAAVDVADGRLLWAFRNQRRQPGGGGWAGSRPPASAGDAAPGSVAGAWFAPFDSEFAYHLPLRPWPAPPGGGFLLSPPFARAGALDLAVEPRTGALMLSARAGRFAALERAAPAAEDGPGAAYQRVALGYLGEGERCAGRCAFVGDLVLVPGDRYLRLLDLAQGGLVVATAPYEESAGTPLGGDAYVLKSPHGPGGPGALGSAGAPGICAVLGLDALWLFALR
ncbi:MAG: hypothetical protein R3F49_02405 [Planctomycetota bacterium]